MPHKIHSSQGTYTNAKGREFYYPSAQQDDVTVRRISCSVVLVGIILLAIVVVFILKNSAGAALLAGALVPGNPFDEGQTDFDAWAITLTVAGVLLVVGSAIFFII